MAAAGLEYRNLGRSGLKVSALSFGVMNFGHVNDLKAATELVKTAVEGGINFFDNAETYGEGQAEVILGQALKDLGYKRSDLVLSTKIFFGRGHVFGAPKHANARGLSRKHIVEGMNDSLAALQTDYVDVVLAHRPDPETPVEETVRAFNHVIDKGQAYYWGTSEWSAAQIQEAWDVAQRLDLIGPIVEQPQYNLLERAKVEKEYLPLYDKYGLGLTTWSPLAGGLLTGRYSKASIPEDSRWKTEFFGKFKDMVFVEEKLDKVDKLKPIAEELGVSLAQLSLAWAYKNPHVSTILLGGSKPAQIVDSLQSVAVVEKLTPEVLAKIDAALGTKPE
ncbi:hypothetical protein WJX72_008571 [[Myrmecia] bisecta]|uniref:NADP-dependent oxidoreductase domain-containing protein n=1 Tax=[Myrmecia] bisecta TaxID=41462 RepID=A0AAW1P0W6_9CHLO